MLLQRLKEYAEREDVKLPPIGYDKIPIHWIIQLDKQGNLLPPFISIGEEGRKRRGRRLLVPFRERTSTAIRPYLLADNGEYLLGVAREESKQDRAKDRHCTFMDLIKECADATGEEGLKAVLSFLGKLDLSTLPLPKGFDPSHNLTFRVDEEILVDLASVQRFWADRFWELSLAEKDEGDTEGISNIEIMSCHICGKESIPVPRHPFKIKIPKGGGKGNAIISANENAFESFGLKASLIAPTCKYCAEQYPKAANYLIQTEDTHITIGSIVYLFWTKEDIGFSLGSLLEEPKSDDVEELIKSAWKGREYTKIDETAFYATALSASGKGRVAVRDWIETTVGRVKENLARWFVLQRIVDPYGQEGKSLRLQELADATVPMKKNRPDKEKIFSQVPKVLLHTALKGGPLPQWLLAQVINRNRVEKWSDRKKYPFGEIRLRQRAALIKMVILSNKYSEGGEEMERLNSENRNPGYLCGRLLAVLEEAQRAAINPSATIVDRFFGTASSAPASVFGRLLRGSQAHLSKLRRDNTGAYHAIQQRLEEILSGLDGFPSVLTLEEQGLFFLGYYHQRANDRAEAIAYKEAKSKKEEENG